MYMKYWLTSLLCVTGLFLAAQEKSSTASYFDLNYFSGNIGLHNNDILHLISGHPEGVILSWNKKHLVPKIGNNDLIITITVLHLFIKI